MGSCIPPGREGNLSVQDLYTQEDAERNVPLANRVARILSSHGIQVAYAPSVEAATAEIVSREQLSSRIELADSVLLCRQKEIPANGVRIARGEAFIMCSPGHPVIITHGRGYTHAAYMGLQSAIDEGRLYGKPPRRFEGILYALAYEYLQLGVPLHEVRALMLFPLKASNFTLRFDDEVYGELNRDRHEYIKKRWGEGIVREDDGQLCMSTLAKAQAKKIGFKSFECKCPLPTRKSFVTDPDPRPEFAERVNLTLVWRL
jgi:hypothetical protein